MEKEYSNPQNPKILDYIDGIFRPEDPVLKEVRERAARNGLPEIQVGKMDSLHLEVIARAAGAKKIVEIGTLAGYSGISLARALPKDGKLYTCEASELHAEVARESFKKAGLSGRVELLVGTAIESLRKITRNGPFDLVFIDADKESYPAYLEWATQNLRVGGAVLADNTFGFGLIADKSFEDSETETAILALRKFNNEIANGGRFRATILPTGEGMTFGVKLR